MITCSNCGTVNEAQQNLCTKCGFSLAVVQSPQPQTIAPTPPNPEQYPQPSQPYYPPPQQYYPPSQQYGQPAPSQPYMPQPSRPVMPGVFGDQPDSSQVQPTSQVQKVFLQNLPQYATNPIAGAIFGGIAAVVTTLLLTLGVSSLVGQAISSALNSSPLGSVSGVADLVRQSSFWLIVAIEHHASINIGSGSLGSASFSLPITILLLIPALAAVLGGYIAAATDYSNQVRFVLGRAASIGPVYAILLAILGATIGTQTILVVSYGPGFISTFFYALIWGTVFALIGGLIKVFGWRWRSGLVSMLLSKEHTPLYAGIVGGLSGVGMALLLTLPLLVFVLGAGGVVSQLSNALSNSSTSGNSIGTLLLILPALSLTAAIWIVAFATGTPFDSSAIGSILQNYTTSSTSLSIFSEQVPRLALLLPIIPIIAYYYGGRAAARTLSYQHSQNQLQAGAYSGLFAGITMALLSFIAGLSFGGSAAGIASATGAFGPDPVRAGIGSLVIGTLFGILGATRFSPRPALSNEQWVQVQKNPLYVFFDSITKQPAGQPRSRPRRFTKSNFQ